ncbi:putative metal-binding motif-containing protein [Pendulispora rubella]|uniref:Metal-binding motif-containing protein n=1 Tax=Pendulispora rubella TaxID=2741070 RepID=A0ABZ2LA23_9BACT
MALRRFLVSALVVLVGMVFLLASGGCEAIITADPPGGWSCDGAFDGGICPQGQRCFNSKCIPCINGNCAVSECETTDKDGDGYFLCGHPNDTGTALIEADCDDTDPDRHPNAPLQCNGKDNNCDGIVDDPCPTGEKCAADKKICQPGGCSAGTCPSPQVCDLGTRLCVVKESAKLGDKCRASAECTTGTFCADANQLGSAVVQADGLCSKACCTSRDCPSEFVCLAAGTGGSYCVRGGAIARPSLGTTNGGEVCQQDAQCRSGVCSGGRCQDTCCSSSQCASGTKCRAMDVRGATAGATNWALSCGVPVNNAAVEGGRCEASAGCGLLGLGNCPPCGEGVCDENPACRAPCCSSSQCGTTCDNIKPREKLQVSSACTPSGTKGTIPTGDGCVVDGDCIGGHCFRDSAGNPYCSDICCTDADCPKTMACRPYDSGNSRYYLRCVRPAVASAVSAPVTP